VGKVKVPGAKNAVLPMMTAAILAPGVTEIRNVPNLKDVQTMIELLEALGLECDFKGEKIYIDASEVKNHVAPYDIVKTMRASFLVLGPLLARLGKADVSLPGGCVLGDRPVDLHLKGLRSLGTLIHEDSGYIRATTMGLRGDVIFFDRPSHTGTENIMMAAVLAKGKTKIFNAAMDPEVTNLGNMLNLMGAKVKGAGTSIIEIEGVDTLHPVQYDVIGDRLIAGTILYAAAATGGDVTVEGISADCLPAEIQKLSEMGHQLDTTFEKKIKLKAIKPYQATNIIAYPYPGFATDLQACAMAALLQSEGVSIIRDTVFPERFSHVPEFNRLGAQVYLTLDTATVVGVKKLRGTTVMASDIRAGAGLVVAGLATEGETTIERIYHIDRGYPQMEEIFSSLGANIQRIKGLNV
jgi:UDP-N-acetylglucosamine 1-carboxyvinyltransferase